MNDRDTIYLQVAMLWHEVVVKQVDVLVKQMPMTKSCFHNADPRDLN